MMMMTKKPITKIIMKTLKQSI